MITGLSLSLQEATAKGFLVEMSGNECSIVEYIGEEEHVIVPQLIEGHLVTKIEENVFKDYIADFLQIPFGVVQLGKSSFERAQIKRLVLPNTIVSIHDYAFCGAVGTVTGVLKVDSYSIDWFSKQQMRFIVEEFEDLYFELRALFEVAEKTIIIDDEPFVLVKESEGIEYLVSLLGLEAAIGGEKLNQYLRYKKGHATVFEHSNTELDLSKTLRKLLSDNRQFIKLTSAKHTRCAKCVEAKYSAGVILCKDCKSIKSDFKTESINLTLANSDWDTLKSISNGDISSLLAKLATEKIRIEIGN